VAYSAVEIPNAALSRALGEGAAASFDRRIEGARMSSNGVNRTLDLVTIVLVPFGVAVQASPRTCRVFDNAI
jgi:hypothetical protein